MTALDDALAAWPPPLRAPILACARGECPPNVALMRLLIAAEVPERLPAELERLAATAAPGMAVRVRALARLARAHPDAWRMVKAVAAAGDHGLADGTAEAQVARWAAAFDRAAALSPDGSVALYALGDAGLLSAATAEVVERLRAWGVLGRDRSVLDLGCGTGRLLVPLAREAARAVGIDVSRAMVEAARRRTAGLSNVEVLHGSGLDLAPVADRSMGLVLAVDCFPYLMRPDLRLAGRHVAEAARVLRPGGSLAVLNVSYRDDPAADARDVARLAAAAGLRVRRSGERGFRHWDALAFELVRPAGP